MKIRDMHEYISATKQFKEFIAENPDSYFGAGFFIINLEDNDSSQRHLDYYLPSTKKIASFDLMGNFKISEQLVERPLEPIDEVRLSVDEVVEIVNKELEKREINVKLQKVIAVLQKKDMELSWNLSCILSNTDFAKMRIKDLDSSIVKFEMINLRDLISVRKKGKFEDGTEGNLE